MNADDIVPGAAKKIDVYSADTDKVPAIPPVPRARAISYDTCARVNALLKYSAITLWIVTPHTRGAARVKEVKPSSNVGYVLVLCNTIYEGDIMLEVNAQHSFDMRFQIR